MKNYYTLYYLLFVLIIMGAFASMAQNGYGLVILGAVSFAFSLTFLFQLIDKKQKPDISSSIELFGLFLISFILGLRVFYIHFPFVEMLFGFAALLLIMVYVQKMIRQFNWFKQKNIILAILIVVFFLSIIFYFISFASVPFVAQFSGGVGIVAFVLLVGFLIAGFLLRNFLIDGENVTVFKTVLRFRDNSVLVLSLFFLFTLYAGLTRAGVLPKIYSDEFPQAYFELVNKAESGKELPVNGKYKYQNFKDRYDQFLKHNNSKDQ